MFTKALARRAVPAVSAACRGCTWSRPSIAVAAATMPLRAKILSHPQMSTQASLASPDILKPVEGDEPADVVFNSLYGIRSIELNRPKKLNALNGSMIRKIGPRLLEWAKSDMANIIVLKGTGEKAFCAGGDVAALVKWNKEGEEGQKRSTDYFALEYQLDHLIATYEKPVVAMMDGITMGGGVGLSIHAPFRIATERTMFSMPETTIGFFPDVGASFFLPRMAGSLGTYLALTSERVTGADVFYTGLATHYLHSTSLPNLESRLAELRFTDSQDHNERLSIINATIEEFCTGLPYDQPITFGGELRKAIDRCFKFDNIDEIIAGLKEEPSQTKQWAEKTIETLHKRSPTSVHVTLRQMRIGRNWSIAETFRREHQIAAKFMKKHDFNEGVTALLIEKRPAKWDPESLEDIYAEDKISEPYFNVENDPPKLELLSNKNYRKYEHNFGVPTEKDVEEKIAEGTWNKGKLVELFLDKTRAKQGAREVVEEIIARKTVADAQGVLVWVYN
ncbi:3-hydroxyisobutyryl-CoA hydrolase-like protein [Cercophora newfieldiana]|uniref:3-hydroxyisobutyryl-CoA hydrolase n=1 Tax=Cercophora newfieldiana TaxID=92897 RepID=A0AA40CV94_9PEZI|nr:3-hydroxyisobutyryl-CoA hydrolase-like protein [Cercophora newfieldiana]